MRISVSFASLVLVLGMAGFAPPPSLSVPFVGCASDGQDNPLPPPTGKAVKVEIDQALASQLAWYKADGAPGVLAPRGWTCFSTHGSLGASLFIAPTLPSGEEILHPWRGMDGPGIQLSVDFGGTAGRFGVARLIARYFPERIAFTQRVIEEGIEPARNFPAGYLPGDRIRRINPNLVEFDTPRGVEGQGTMSWLRVNNLAIHGAVKIEGADVEPETVQLSVRVQPAMADLVAPIIARFEHEDR